jgi:hypothetical protein
LDIHLFLTLLSGLCWTVVYIDGIRIGFRDHSFAIPFWALVLNLAWEFLYGVEGYISYGWKPQTVINILWFLLDIGILYTFLRYGRKYFPRNLPVVAFPLWTILGLLSAFILQWLFYQEFGFGPGAKYSAFLQNLLMSILFISMLVKRGGPEGQSLNIAINKWIGTLAPTIHLGWIDDGPVPFILGTGALIALFDLLYIGLLIWYRRGGQKRTA